jgi:two-component system chemotaxis sensor kinase CheA
MLDESLIADFITESREHLDGIEPDLLGLEGSDQVSGETINRIFRAIHSIKGGAGFLAFTSLKKLSHCMENVLMAMRDGKLSPTPEITDVLLRGVDKLRAMLDDLQSSDTIPCDEELAELESFMQASPLRPITQSDAHVDSAPEAARSGNAIKTSTLSALGLTAERVQTLHSPARFLYQINIDATRDLAPQGQTIARFLESIALLGDCLGSKPPMAELSKCTEVSKPSTPVSLLISSVLEPDLAGLAFELPEHCVTHVTLPALPGEPEAPPVVVPPPSPDVLGQILIETFGIDPKDILGAARKQGEGDKRQIGALLLEAGAISAEVLVKALNIQHERRTPATVSRSTASAEAAPEAAVVQQHAAVAPETLRVRVDVLSRLMNSAGELVLARNQLLRALDELRLEKPSLNEILQNIDLVTSDLQEGVMQTRIQPIGTVFSRYSRVVRDTARTLGKDIALHVHGTEVELDKSILEALADPLTHLIRNSADHGIELPEVRREEGKSRQGNITLSAWHEGGQVNISIVDDGRGMDPKAIFAKAVEKGIVAPDAADKLSTREILELIFAPGFSTAETVSDLSGRGVGMDVVKTNIEKLGGVVSIESRFGSGTTIQLQLPLTLAIIPTIIVGVAEERFALPQVNIEEFVWVRAAEVKQRIEYFHDCAVLRLRGRLLPLVNLASLLGLSPMFEEPETGELRPSKRVNLTDRRGLSKSKESAKESEVRSGADRRADWHGDYNVVVLRVGKNRFGLIVDRLYDTEEIVVKPLSAFYKSCRCFSGATILGDGQVVLILDVLGISTSSNLHFADIAAEDQRRNQDHEQRARETAQHQRSVLMLRGGGSEQFAVPQSSILRLERVESMDIQRMGDREFIDYRGGALPLLRLEQVLPVQPISANDDGYFLVIPKTRTDSSGMPTAGILVSEIVDACDLTVKLDTHGMSGLGIEGSAIVDEHLTLFLEPEKLLAAAGLTQERTP